MIVWCVEDDASIRDIEVYTLRATGFEAKGFPDAAAFREALQAGRPDLIILDIMLPGVDGVELLELLRADPATRQIPVIMATARGEEYDKVRSLDLGADDYLVKPFGMMEMVSRVKAVLRRTQPADAQRLLQFDGISLNLDEHTVFVDGERAQMTRKEFELLKLFLSRPGMLYTRSQLFCQVWGEDYAGETRTLDMHITTLRQKLGPYGKRIETVRGVGYRFEVSP